MRPFGEEEEDGDEEEAVAFWNTRRCRDNTEM